MTTSIARESPDKRPSLPIRVTAMREGCSPALRVREFMTPNPPRIEDALAVGSALGVLSDEGLLALPLVSDGVLKGTVTAAALLEPVVIAYEQGDEAEMILDALDASVREIFDEGEDAPCCTDSDSLTEACRVMAREGLPALPVTCRGDVVGVLTATDVVRAVSELDRPLRRTPGRHVVSEWMTSQVLTVDPDDAVSTALDVMAAEGVRHLLVTLGAELRGVLSNGDVLRAAKGAQGRKLELDLRHRKVREVMTTAPLHTTTPDSPIAGAAALMSNHRVNSLPVLAEGRVVGVLTTRDLLAALCVCAPPAKHDPEA